MRLRDWKNKALAFRVFEAVPFTDALVYAAQRYLTGSSQRDLSGKDSKYVEIYERHLKAFREHRDISNASYYEFGAGADLAANLYFYACGIGDQHLVDLYHIATEKQVLRMAGELRKRPPSASTRAIPDGDNLSEILAKLSIRYDAPTDARSVQRPDKSVDIVSSIFTLEHIPLQVIEGIMAECRRMIADDGVAVMTIDYADHYAGFDRTINVYNFLRYNSSQWAKFNPSRHFQSRARHSQYREIFKRSGFQVTHEHLQYPDQWESLLAEIPLAREFQGFDPKDLGVEKATFVLIPT